MDVVYALKRQGRTLYGFDSGSVAGYSGGEKRRQQPKPKEIEQDNRGANVANSGGKSHPLHQLSASDEAKLADRERQRLHDAHLQELENRKQRIHLQREREKEERERKRQEAAEAKERKKQEEEAAAAKQRASLERKEKETETKRLQSIERRRNSIDRRAQQLIEIEEREAREAEEEKAAAKKRQSIERKEKETETKRLHSLERRRLSREHKAQEAKKAEEKLEALRREREEKEAVEEKRRRSAERKEQEETKRRHSVERKAEEKRRQSLERKEKKQAEGEEREMRLLEEEEKERRRRSSERKKQAAQEEKVEHKRRSTERKEVKEETKEERKAEVILNDAAAKGIAIHEVGAQGSMFEHITDEEYMAIRGHLCRLPYPVYKDSGSGQLLWGEADDEKMRDEDMYFILTQRKYSPLIGNGHASPAFTYIATKPHSKSILGLVVVVPAEAKYRAEGSEPARLTVKKDGEEFNLGKIGIEILFLCAQSSDEKGKTKQKGVAQYLIKYALARHEETSEGQKHAVAYLELPKPFDVLDAKNAKMKTYKDARAGGAVPIALVEYYQKLGFRVTFDPSVKNRFYRIPENKNGVPVLVKPDDPALQHIIRSPFIGLNDSKKKPRSMVQYPFEHYG